MIKISTFFFFFISFTIFSQNETANWYFGNEAGLIFDRGNVISVDHSAMNAPAGSASISNEKGELMFYSDGATVWNRNHQVMENGTELAGDNANFQSAIIIPKPGDENTYYLFYSRSENGTNPLVTAGTFYSEIVFSNAFPLGRVSTKNAFLSGDSPSEKLTAVHHKDGESFWLVTLNGEDDDKTKPKKKFNVYQITKDGIQRPGIETPAQFDIENLGAMKLSVNGKKLVVTANTRDDSLRYLHLYDFDNATGVLTFVTRIIIDPPPTNWPSKGVEFSPNGKYLYVSYTLGNGDGLMQYKIEDVGIEDEQRFYLLNRNGVRIESLQLANDQKIYVAMGFNDSEASFLATIDNPNEYGLESNFNFNGISLEPKTSRKGLPNFIQSYFASKIITQNQCYVDEFSFSAESYASISNVLWDFGDGTTATGINTKHTYANPGLYTVEGILTVGLKKVTVYKIVNAYALPNLIANQELIECDEDMDGLSTFNLFSITPKITNIDLNESLTFYTSLDNLNNNIEISDAENFQNTTRNQQLFVKVTNSNGCFETTSFVVKTRFVELNNIPDYFVCEDSDGIAGNIKGQFETETLEISIRSQLGLASSSIVSFYPTFTDAQTNLNKYQNTFTSSSRSIFLKVQEADLSCGGIKEFSIVVNSNLKIDLQDRYTICFNPTLKPPVIINATSSFDRVEWKNSEGSTISSQEDFILNAIGEFSLTVYKTENGLTCSTSKNFTVENPSPPTFSQINVNTEDETNNSIDISISGNSSYAFSLDNINFSGNSNSFTFTNVSAGLQTVYVRDFQNCEQPIQTIVAVIGYKKYFTPNGDGINDFWNINGLDGASFKSINVRIFNRYGRLVATISDFSTQGWDGSFNGKKLHSNSYWFVSEIVDNDNNLIKKTGKFSLIND